MAVTDNFNRADGGLGANWTTDSAFSGLTIVSNACKGSTGSAHNVAVYTAGGTIAADQYAQCKVTATGGFIGLVLRSDGAGTFYVCYYSAGTATLYRWVAGSAGGFATGSTITPAVNDVIYFEVVGSAFTMKVNGVTVCTGTDAIITGAGYTGINIYDTAGAVDDFEGGVAGAVAVNVNLTGVAADPQVGAGTVAIDSTVTITPPFEGYPAYWDVWPKAEEKVYLTGVAADPQIGNGSVYALQSAEEILERYPFPQVEVQREPKRIPPLVVHAKPPPSPMIFVHPVGVQLMPAVGTGTIRLSYDVPEDEMLVLTAMLADL